MTFNPQHMTYKDTHSTLIKLTQINCLHRKTIYPLLCLEQFYGRKFRELKFRYYCAVRS
jgi:hypothetical protein